MRLTSEESKRVSGSQPGFGRRCRGGSALAVALLPQLTACGHACGARCPLPASSARAAARGSRAAARAAAVTAAAWAVGRALSYTAPYPGTVLRSRACESYHPGPWLFLQNICDGESLEGACHRTDFDDAAAQHLKARLLRRLDLRLEGAYPLGRRLFGWHREQVLACGAHNRELVRSRTLSRPPRDGRARLAQRNDSRRLVLIRLVEPVKVDEANVACSEQLGLPSHVAEHAAARPTLIDGAVQTRRCTRGTHLAREQSARVDAVGAQGVCHGVPAGGSRRSRVEGTALVAGAKLFGRHALFLSAPLQPLVEVEGQLAAPLLQHAPTRHHGTEMGEARLEHHCGISLAAHEWPHQLERPRNGAREPTEVRG
eukprot:scaffold12436_cov62-Phaeocystis_antarctica.AAC.2